MLQSKYIRSLTLTCFLFLSVTLFHLLGSGEFGFSPYVGPLFLSAFLIFAHKPLPTFDGPGLALVIVTFQILGHFTVTSGLSQSDSKMLLSHSVASVITYFGIKYFDVLATACDSIMSAISPKILDWVLGLQESYAAFICMRNTRNHQFAKIQNLIGPAPPTF
jgi:hypothetical protein